MRMAIYDILHMKQITSNSSLSRRIGIISEKLDIRQFGIIGIGFQIEGRVSIHFQTSAAQRLKPTNGRYVNRSAAIARPTGTTCETSR